MQVKSRPIRDVKLLVEVYFQRCKGRELKRDGETVCDRNGCPVIVDAIPPTLTGLALALGYRSRMDLIAHRRHCTGTRRQLLDNAFAMCEEYAEQQLLGNPAGTKFYLAQNFDGWSSAETIETLYADDAITVEIE